MKIKNIIEKFQRSKIFKDSFWALFGNSVAKFLALIVGVVIANLLGSEDYGKYGLVKSTLISISVFSTFGLGVTGTKYIAQYKDTRKEWINCICRDILRISVFMSAFIAVLIFLFADIIAEYMELGNVIYALRLSCVAIVFNAINSAQTGILAGFQKFKTISNNNVITGTFLCIIAIVCTLLWGLTGTIIALSSSYVLNFLLNHFILKKIRLAYPFNIKQTFIKDMLSFSVPLALQEGLQSFSNWVIIFVIVKLSCYSEYGIYSAAAQWTAAISFIPAILKNVALSYLSDQSNDHKRIVKWMLYANFMSSGFFFLVVILASPFIAKGYGNSYNGVELVLSILVFSSVLGSLGSVFIQELISKSKNWLTFFVTLLKSVITISVGAMLIIGFEQRGSFSLAISALMANIIYLSFLVVSYKISTE